MSDKRIKLPELSGLSHLLLSIILIVVIMVYSKGIMIPFVIASILAILLYPLASWLERKLKLHRVIANFIVILFLMFVISSVFILCYKQLNSFLLEIPNLQKSLLVKSEQIQYQIYNLTGIKPYKQMNWINDRLNIFIENSGEYISQTIYNATAVLVNFGIILFYLFFMIYYREKFWFFIRSITPDSNHSRIQAVLFDIKELIQRYVNGIFIVVAIMTTMVTIGLYIIGVPYALFFGIITGLLNIIPYIGILISGSVAIVFTLLSMDGAIYPLLVALVFFLSHAFEANLLTPKIVGGFVSVNPLITFLALLIGGEIWGISGMILFIPLVGIFKVICDNIPQWSALSVILGTETYIKKNNFRMKDTPKTEE